MKENDFWEHIATIIECSLCILNSDEKCQSDNDKECARTLKSFYKTEVEK